MWKILTFLELKCENLGFDLSWKSKLNMLFLTQPHFPFQNKPVIYGVSLTTYIYGDVQDFQYPKNWEAILSYFRTWLIVNSKGKMHQHFHPQEDLRIRKTIGWHSKTNTCCFYPHHHIISWSQKPLLPSKVKSHKPS